MLEATAAVVAEKGYAGTSVNAIIERAGISRKTFYELYANKEEAFLGAYAAIDIVIERMTAAAAAEHEPREMMRAGAREYLETLAAEPDFTRMLVVEAVGAGPRVLARRAEAFRDFTRVLALPLEDPPDRALLLALLGGINELVLQHVDRARGREPARAHPHGPRPDRQDLLPAGVSGPVRRPARGSP